MLPSDLFVAVADVRGRWQRDCLDEFVAVSGLPRTDCEYTQCADGEVLFAGWNTRVSTDERPSRDGAEGDAVIFRKLTGNRCGAVDMRRI